MNFVTSHAMAGNGRRQRLDPQLALLAATLGLALAAAIFFVDLSMPIERRLAADFKIFWAADRLADQLVYDFQAVTAAYPGPTDFRPFVHPPSFLLAFSPFAHMPLWLGYSIWTVLSLALFCSVSRYAGGARILPLLLAAPALHWAVLVGQITLVVGGLLYLAMLLMERRPLIAGVILACAALLKPQAALLLPVALLASGNVRTLLSAFAAGAFAGVLCLLVQGVQLWIEWTHAIGEFTALIRGNGFIGNCISPAGFAYSIGAKGYAEWAIIAVGAALGVALCWHVCRNASDPVLRAGALISGSILCTPYALPYEAASLLPAAAALLLRGKQSPATLLTAALTIVFPFSPISIAAFAAGLAVAVPGRLRQKPAPELSADGRGARADWSLAGLDRHKSLTTPPLVHQEEPGRI